jgi:hypothetical protein
MGYYNPDTEEEIKVCTDTMKNFFSYLLYQTKLASTTLNKGSNIATLTNSQQQHR